MVQVYLQGKIHEIDVDGDSQLVVGYDYFGWKKYHHLLSTVTDALDHHGVPFIRAGSKQSGGYWLRNFWVYEQGIYAPFQIAQNELGRVALGNGGLAVQGNGLLMVSKEAASSHSLLNTYGTPLYSGSRIAIQPERGFDIDVYVSYIPWKNLYVIEENTWNHHPNLESRLEETNSEVVLAGYMEPNMLVDESREFVMTYGSPNLSKRLRAKGVDVIEVSSYRSRDLGSMTGSVRCITNFVHPGVLPFLADHLPKYNDVSITSSTHI